MKKKKIILLVYGDHNHESKNLTLKGVEHTYELCRMLDQKVKEKSITVWMLAHNAAHETMNIVKEYFKKITFDCSEKDTICFKVTDIDTINRFKETIKSFRGETLFVITDLETAEYAPHFLLDQRVVKIGHSNAVLIHNGAYEKIEVKRTG